MMRAGLVSLAAWLLAAAPAVAQEQPQSGPVFTPSELPYPFSDAVQVGDVLYLSGDIGTNDEGTGVVPGGIEAETRRIFERLGTRLASHGLTYADVFKCTVMLADMAEWPAFNAIYSDYFEEGRYPARSALGANGLALGASVELECLAHKPASSSPAKRTIMPEGGPGLAMMEQFGFSEAVIHGNTVYLSGVIAGPAPEGMTREEAYDRTFQYIGSVLARAGSSWDGVVDLTTYHVDIDASLPAIVAVKNKYVKAPFPAWTAIDIDRLFAPEGEVEIKVTARVTPKAE